MRKPFTMLSDDEKKEYLNLSTEERKEYVKKLLTDRKIVCGECGNLLYQLIDIELSERGLLRFTCKENYLTYPAIEFSERQFGYRFMSNMPLECDDFSLKKDKVKKPTSVGATICSPFIEYQR